MQDTNIKLLYETQVKKQIEEPSIEIVEENGAKIEIKRTVKKVKPIKLAAIKADRKLFKAAEMFYAKSLSYYLKEGLMPYSLVSKRYANDGGPMTDNERDKLKELRAESKRLEEEFYTIGTEVTSENTEKKNKLLQRINKINMEISSIQNAYADIFDVTAEVKSRNDVIEWWVLHLLYVDLDGQGYKPFFGDGSYEEKVKQLEAFDNREDPFELECIKKLSYLISFWFTSRNNVTKLDFDAMVRLYDESMSDYDVKDTDALKITEITPPPVATEVTDTTASVTPIVPASPATPVETNATT